MTSHATDTDYAFWASPDESFRVTYSLEQFHEIDFEVSEGYRRIPHGGIEVGGLLFGHSKPGQVRIEAFRMIQCEHATGPSFTLSERDLEELQKQIDGSASDPELAGLSVVGWFIAHTRSPLRLSDRELAIFDRFFPKADQITVLAKPERFQPTKFAFFSRKKDMALERDGANTAIILPLSGRSARSSGGPVASIPAPPPAVAPPPAAPTPPPDPQPVSKQVQIPRTDSEETQEAPIQPPVQSAAAAKPTAPIAEAAVAQQPAERKAAENTSDTADTGPVTSLTTIPKEKKLPPISEIQRRRSAHTQSALQRNRGLARGVEDESRAYQVRLVLVLLLAAVLGCAVGYWAYGQLPAPTVPLSVRSETSGLVVTWPIEQTRRAPYAAIRVNDGAQQALSTDEKTVGAARITPPSASNVKVELIVQHWMRDSRGIVRYLSAAAAEATPDQQVTR